LTAPIIPPEYKPIQSPHEALLSELNAQIADMKKLLHALIVFHNGQYGPQRPGQERREAGDILQQHLKDHPPKELPDPQGGVPLPPIR
jgi:hypothetical protein